MPLYQYRCEECDAIQDKLLRIAEREDTIQATCTACEQETKLHYQIGAPAISYMGINQGGKIAGDLKNRFDQLRKHYPAMRSQY